MEIFLYQLKDGKIHLQYLYVKQLNSPIHRMNFMVEVRENVAVPWMGQLSYLCGSIDQEQTVSIVKAAHADFLVTNNFIKFIY